MNEAATITRVLHQAARRRRIDRALRGLWMGLAAGMAVWFLLIATYKVLPLPESWMSQAWVLPLAGAALGGVAGGWRRISAGTAARVLEHRQSLDQRLSTAWELLKKSPDSDWTRLVVGDAAQRATALDVRKALPLHLPRFAAWLPLVAIGIIGLGWVPEYRSDAWRRQQAEAAAIAETGRAVAAFIREELKQRPPASEPIRDALGDAALQGDRLQQANLTRANALADLANAAQRMQEENRRLENSPLLRQLAQAARQQSGTGQQSSAGRSSSQAGQNAAAASPEALQKMAEQLERARRSAASAAAQPNNAESREAAMAALAELMRSANQAGLNLAGLDAAMKALEGLTPDRALQGLEAAGTELEKLREMAEKMAAANPTSESPGRDLAEQLERAQAETAAETLEKMVRDLQSASLTPEQLQQALEEVTKALNPSQSYGKVADLLQEAIREMKDKKPGEASRQLAEAAKELRRLSEEAKDLNQLADAMQAMQDAQMALMNGKAWQPGQCQGGACKGCSSCKGSGSGKGGLGKGGRPGRGVGTWADENDWLYYPEITERWDNSGLTRPDMEGRAPTDRGDGLNPQNITPTRLRGQFSPGPMPSVPLPGVSIRGQSTVPYQEAVNSAQADARSALNEDRVPRAYRQAVKGYFDDLE